MPGKAKKNSKVFVPKSSPAPIQNDNAKESNARGGAEESPSSGTIEPMGQEEASSTAPLSKETQVAAHIPDNVGDSGQGTTSVDQGLASLESQVRPPDGTRPTKDGPLEKILQTEPPAEGTQADGLNIPHLHPPPFIHNFDSYTLVKEVEKGGFTPGQAITAMKGVRVLLANNLELAKKGLVSKSDVENVSLRKMDIKVGELMLTIIDLQQSYLFRAACSELRIEIQNTRKANDEKMRRERTLLQHEFDTLSQKLSQELSALKDELTGMFNDRKMAVKMKQREMDSAVSPLYHKYSCGSSPLKHITDPTTQLQDHRLAQQRLQIRSRGPALGAHSTICPGNRIHGTNGSVLFKICQLQGARG